LSDLLACPFCGGGAEIEAEYERVNLNRSWMKINCIQCGAGIESNLIHASAKSLRQGQKNTIIDKWNLRFTPGNK